MTFKRVTFRFCIDFRPVGQSGNRLEFKINKPSTEQYFFLHTILLWVFCFDYIQLFDSSLLYIVFCMKLPFSAVPQAPYIVIYFSQHKDVTALSVSHDILLENMQDVIQSQQGFNEQPECVKIYWMGKISSVNSVQIITSKHNVAVKITHICILNFGKCLQQLLYQCVLKH